MPEKSFGSVELRALIASVAGPRSWSDTRDSWLDRAARRAGISYRQCRALFYGEITDVNHRSARLLRDAAERLSKRHETETEAVHERAKVLASSFETIAHAMEQVDSDFYRKTIAQLIDAAGQIRNLDRAGNDQDK